MDTLQESKLIAVESILIALIDQFSSHEKLAVHAKAYDNLETVFWLFGSSSDAKEKSQASKKEWRTLVGFQIDQLFRMSRRNDKPDIPDDLTGE